MDGRASTAVEAVGAPCSRPSHINSTLSETAATGSRLHPRTRGNARQHRGQRKPAHPPAGRRRDPRAVPVRVEQRLLPRPARPSASLSAAQSQLDLTHGKQIELGRQIKDFGQPARVDAHRVRHHKARSVDSQPEGDRPRRRGGGRRADGRGVEASGSRSRSTINGASMPTPRCSMPSTTTTHSSPATRPSRFRRNWQTSGQPGSS